MHYYQFNIGDYRKKTGHLTLVEHAIYRSLIDSYYLTENPLELDVAKLMRSHSARSSDEKEAFNNVLEEFFIETDEGYTHVNCDDQLKKIYDKSDKARRSAKARWAKKDAKPMLTGSERITIECERIDNGCELDATHYPLPNNPLPIKKTSSSVDDCPHSDIVEKYHSCLPQLRRVKVWNDKRKKNLRTRWREDTKHQSLEFWERLFNYVGTSDFLIGNKTDFQADLEWIINPSNFVKIVEGKYHE